VRGWLRRERKGKHKKQGTRRERGRKKTKSRGGRGRLYLGLSKNLNERTKKEG